MNDVLIAAIDAAIRADPSVSPVQREAAIAILAGREPQRLPAFMRRTFKRIQSADIFPTQPDSAPDRTSDGTPYLDRRGAAAYLGVSIRLLDECKARGDIPFIRVARRKVMFRREDLDGFMSSRRKGGDALDRLNNT